MPATLGKCLDDAVKVIILTLGPWARVSSTLCVRGGKHDARLVKTSWPWPGSTKQPLFPVTKCCLNSREPDRQPWRQDLMSDESEGSACQFKESTWHPLLFVATSDFWNGNSDLWKLASESNSFLILKGCLLLKVMVILMSDFGI